MSVKASPASGSVILPESVAVSFSLIGEETATLLKTGGEFPVPLMANTVPKKGVRFVYSVVP